MPPETLSSLKADPWGMEEEEVSSLKIISGVKNKAFNQLTEDVSKQCFL